MEDNLKPYPAILLFLDNAAFRSKYCLYEYANPS